MTGIGGMDRLSATASSINLPDSIQVSQMAMEQNKKGWLSPSIARIGH